MVAKQWTDDWDKCRNTCVGQFITGVGVNKNPNDNNLCFYFQLENACLYGVFEPHNGVEAAKGLLHWMASELLFQNISSLSDEEIRDMLRNAFATVEKAYIQNYDGMIAERTGLQYQLQTLNDTQISQESNTIISRLTDIDKHLSGGATVVLALVCGDRLYVANVGEVRALLCRTDDNSVLRVVQLSVDHSLNNEDELLRLSQLGLDINKLRNAQYLGNQSGTRCLGNYLVKGLYKAFPELRAAQHEPVVATPEIHGPITLDENCRFLVLVSAGVHKRIQEVRGCAEQTNKQLSQVIVENFRKETDFNNLSRSVLQEIEEEFLGYCIENSLTPKSNTHMSLMIRNFNFPMPNATFVPEPLVKTEQIHNLAPKLQNTSVRFNPIIQSKSTTLLNNLDSDVYSDSSRDHHSTNDSRADTNRTVSSETSDVYPNPRLNNQNRRIKGYVDFSCYYENVEKARQNGTLPSFIK